MVPLSARADETPAAMTTTRATSALRNLNERILFSLISEAASAVPPRAILAHNPEFAEADRMHCAANTYSITSSACKIEKPPASRGHRRLFQPYGSINTSR
jgi:hypothetical protein